MGKKPTKIDRVLKGISNIVAEATRSECYNLNEIADQNKIMIRQKEEELNTKDRVDISLREYNRLVNENKNLITERDYYKKLFAKMGIDEKLIHLINPQTLEIGTFDDPQCLIKMFHIKFGINCHDIRRYELETGIYNK